MVSLVAMAISIWFFSLLYAGVVLKLLWSWFVVPFGIMPITVAWAIGLSCIVELAKGVPASFNDLEADSVIYELLKPYIAITLFLIIGFIAHLFV